MGFQLYVDVVQYNISEDLCDSKDDSLLFTALVLGRGILIMVQCTVYTTLPDDIV